MKIKSKVMFKIVPAVLAGMLALSGCSGNSTKTSSESGGSASGKTVNLTMSVWGNPDELKVYQKGIDAYTKEHPNVKIKMIPVPSEGYEQKLLTQLQGGNASDVFYVGDTTMAKLAKKGALAELGKFMKSDESYAKPDEYAVGLWGAAKQGDKIYGISVDCNPVVMYYNKKMFKDLGIKSPQEYFDEGKWNWNAFNEVTKKLKDAGKKGFIAEQWLMDTWIWSNGGLSFDESGNYVMDQNQKAKDAIQFVNDLMKKRQITYAGSLPKGQGIDAMFLSNQVGIVAAGRWLTPMFSQNKSLKFDYISWPTNTGNKMEPVQIPVAYIAVNKKSKEVDEAMKFATFYVSKEGQKERLTGNGSAVPSVSGIDDIVTSDKTVEHSQYLIDGRETGFASGSPKLFKGQVPGLNKEIEDQYDLLFLKKQDVDTTIKKISEKSKKMIEEFKAGN
ncbi:sugar ABC transporter substrate-binding protein [Bacillus sp. ISL-75]|uniref:ABC transporter substrate-binding protein n=1 Tax=Bacillus sp. ISL-75 TaxID=2819137 RepID=UPI001BE7545A|nr:sugar ABC transporter substrate-binding protein [Bacillus sp. ISL-75]MBT2730428.1 sugar ABC transporter substrate-binding protein [Bacillus sp. ISL-75]